MYSPFRSRGRESSRELERGNSMRELACNDLRGSGCPRTRTNLLLRGRRELRRCIPQDFSS